MDILEESQDKLIEIQNSYVTQFIKQKLQNDNLVVSKDFKQQFSQSLSLYLLFLADQIEDLKKDGKSKITKQDLLSILDNNGFDELANQLLDSQVNLKKSDSSKKKKNQQEQTSDQNPIQ